MGLELLTEITVPPAVAPMAQADDRVHDLSGPFRTEGTAGRMVGTAVVVEEGDDVASLSPEPEPLLTPAEVAAMFRVDPKTVTRWAKAGKLTSIRTLGGHRRYRQAEVRALLAGEPYPGHADTA